MKVIDGLSEPVIQALVVVGDDTLASHDWGRTGRMAISNQLYGITKAIGPADP